MTENKSDFSNASVCYLLSGEFDNKYGPTITCQYPEEIPGFGSVPMDQETDNASQLASLLIPNNAENRTLIAPDSNVFTLYLNKGTMKYQLLPPVDKFTERAGVKRPSRLTFLNVVKTESDETNSRGAKIRSIAVGTSLTNVEVLKPFLNQALLHVMDVDDVDGLRKILFNCFRALSSVNLYAIEASLFRSHIVQTLNSVRRKAALSGLLSDDTQLGRAVLKSLNLNPTIDDRNVLRLRNGKLLMFFKSEVVDNEFADLTKDPIEMSLFNTMPSLTKDDISRVFRFLQRFLPALANIPSGQYSCKLIVNSHESRKEQICHFVTTLSQLMGCIADDEQTKYCDRVEALILPYAEVSMLKSIKETFAAFDTSELFVIVGTANSIFQHHKHLWDYYYDLDEDKLLTSNEEITRNRNSLWDSGLIKKLLQKNINDVNSFHITESERVGLVAAFVNNIIDVSPTEDNILSTLRKVNVLQIQSQLRETRVSNSDFCSVYVTGFRDLVKFNDLFRPESLTAIRLFARLDHIVSSLYDSAQSLMRRQDLLSQLLDLLSEVISFIENSDQRLLVFLKIALNYSPFQSLAEGNLMVKDFSSINLYQEVAQTYRKHRSWISVIDEGTNAGLFETFAKERGLDLLSMSLLVNPDIHKPKLGKSSSLERVSVDSLSISSASSGNSNAETRRPRSMSLRWIKNIPKNLDNFIEAPWSEAAPVSSSPGRLTVTKSTGGSLSSASSISSSSSLRVSSRSFRQKTDSVKRLAAEILSRIKNHPLGDFLINEEMSSFCQTLFHVSETEFLPSQ